MKDEIQNLWKGESIELLKELHILTRDGKLNADSRRKLKQVHHLSQLIRPLIQKIAEKKGFLHVVDVGAGKSYLGFILYDLELRKLPDFRLTAIENRSELVERSKLLAEKSQFEKMDFRAANIEDAILETGADVVTALHACDTATDDAILFGLRNGACGFALVPCCQAEVARELEKVEKNPSLVDETVHALYEFPIHRREFGSHLTNVIRTLFLRSKGYRVTVTELVGFEHSMKNELILAEKISNENHPESKRAENELKLLLTRFPIKMKLLA